MNSHALKEFFKTKGARLIIALGILGISLIFLSSLKQDTPKTLENEKTENGDYCLMLEQKIEEIVKSITGSERVSVIVTLESGTQYIYADEGKTSESENKNDNQQTYTIIKGENGEETGLLVTEYMPTVRGIAIVCDAFTPDAKERVLEAVKAALDISERKIYVTQYAY